MACFYIAKRTPSCLCSADLIFLDGFCIGEKDVHLSSEKSLLYLGQHALDNSSQWKTKRNYKGFFFFPNCPFICPSCTRGRLTMYRGQIWNKVFGRYFCYCRQVASSTPLFLKSLVQSNRLLCFSHTFISKVLVEWTNITLSACSPCAGAERRKYSSEEGACRCQARPYFTFSFSLVPYLPPVFRC